MDLFGAVQLFKLAKFKQSDITDVFDLWKLNVLPVYPQARPLRVDLNVRLSEPYGGANRAALRYLAMHSQR